MHEINEENFILYSFTVSSRQTMKGEVFSQLSNIFLRQVLILSGESECRSDFQSDESPVWDEILNVILNVFLSVTLNVKINETWLVIIV